MIWQFDPFELDDDRRELTLHGREVLVEPLVFDLLADLVRNRERVVTKDELLERVWGGAIVTESSLQRAVSLARSALRTGGRADAIKTVARHGYRFSANVIEVAPGRPAQAQPADSGSLARARMAFDQSDWNLALSSFGEAEHDKALPAPDLERVAWCLLNLGRPGDAIPWLERTAAAHSLASDSLGAARAAILLCQVHLEGRRSTVAHGWRQRAKSLLAGVSSCREVAQFEWVTGRLALAEGDFDADLQHAETALSMARTIEDPDLEAVALIYLGHVCIARGEVQRGLALHDEAGAAVLGGPVAPWFAGLVYCGLIYICQNRGDWPRAAQWTEAFGRWSERSPTTIFPAVCRLHRAEVLALRGELATAQIELTEVKNELEISAPWAVGDAERLYGEVLRAHGDLDGAEQAFRRAQVVGWDSCPGWAELLIERNDSAAAVRALEKAIEDPSWPCRQRRRILFAALSRALAIAGDNERAIETLKRAVAIEDGEITPVQHGALERARAEIAVAEGRTNDAIQILRSTLRFWRDIDALLEIASLHERLAELLVASGDIDGAILELDAAHAQWESVGSTTRANRCAERRATLRH